MMNQLNSRYQKIMKLFGGTTCIAVLFFSLSCQISYAAIQTNNSTGRNGTDILTLLGASSLTDLCLVRPPKQGAVTISKVSIFQGEDNTGKKIFRASLPIKVTPQNAPQFEIELILQSNGGVGGASTTLRTNRNTLAANLNTLTARQQFTNSMINTLQTGADNLTLADINEGANMLTLLTKQALSTTSLSNSNQAAQAVLKLF